MPKKQPLVDMREYIHSRCALAEAYARDGAYHSAARILAELTGDVAAHAERVTQMINDAVDSVLK